MSPFSVSATTTELSLMMAGSSSGLFMSRGSATETPCWRKGVMTMKMISSTSIMSTIGVTLMSEVKPPPPPDDMPISLLPRPRSARGASAGAPAANNGAVAPAARERGGGGARSEAPVTLFRKPLRPELPRAVLQEVVDQLGRRVVHLDDEAVDLAREVVEEPHGGHRHGEPERGRQQRLGDAARDGADTGRLSRLHAGERVDDAEHRAEETHERGGRADGGETREAALELGRLDGDGALESALAGLDLVARDVGRSLVRAELLEAGVDDHREVRLLVLVADVDGLLDAVVLQRLGDARGELARLLLGGRVGQVALDHDGDGVHRHDQQDDDDGQRHPPEILHHLGDGEGALEVFTTLGGLLEQESEEAESLAPENAQQNSHGRNPPKVFGCDGRCASPFGRGASDPRPSRP